MNSKRWFDVIASVAALFLLSPLFGLIAIAIKMTSRGPVIFRQMRMGFQREEFVIYKFRTLRNGSGHPGVDLTSGDDQRITRVGRFLRRSRLDETPQFLNVLRGEMSVVGPRPYEIAGAKLLLTETPSSALRYLVKPGITGLAQVNGRKGKRMEDMAMDVAHDVEYLKNRSLRLDCLILLKTVPVVLHRKGI